MKRATGIILSKSSKHLANMTKQTVTQNRLPSHAATWEKRTKPYSVPVRWGGTHRQCFKIQPMLKQGT